VLLDGNAEPADVFAALNAAGFRYYAQPVHEEQALRTPTTRAPTRGRRAGQ
jgi:hypothetical protein